MRIHPTFIMPKRRALLLLGLLLALYPRAAKLPSPIRRRSLQIFP
jgi:hypothetical protein